MEDKILRRHEAREQAFLLLFESTFNNNSIDEILDNAMVSREVKINDFSKAIFNGVEENKTEIDSLIEKYSVKWKKNRLPKVTISALRLAIFEMLFLDDVPVSVSINEAVELTKLYAAKEDAAFVNGVLGSFSKELKSKS